MEDDIIRYLKEKTPLIDSIIKRYLPEAFSDDYSKKAFGEPSYEYDNESLTKALSEPTWDLLGRGGKRWRPALFLLISEIFGSDIEKVKDFVVVPELAHNGSLIIDDIEDLGELRRGKPCTHKIFGNDVAINAGNFLYFIPSIVFRRLRDRFDDKTLIRAYEAYCEEMTNIHIGQALDIWWHKGKKEDVTERQYLQMVAYKTGTLARLAARLAVILSGEPEKTETMLGRLAERLGIAFQIQDDVLSASQGDFNKKKGYGDDITEGKRSLLVINCLSTAPETERRELLDILSRHTRDPKLIQRALDILRKNGSVDYAKSFASRLVEDAWSEAEPTLPDNQAKETLGSLMRFAIKRRI